MNKYKVTRHREHHGVETTKDSVIFAKSEERAISIVRYASTRSDKLPNGELTDYTTDDGTHIWWTAEPVEIGHEDMAAALANATAAVDGTAEAWARLKNATTKTPEAKPAPELETLDTLEEAISMEKPAAGDSVHVIALGEYADKFRKIKTTLGLKKNTAAFAAILDAYEKQDITASTFSLSDDLEARVANFAELFNTNRDEIIAKAVISYLNRLGGMTLNELIKRKEAKHDT